METQNSITAMRVTKGVLLFMLLWGLGSLWRGCIAPVFRAVRAYSSYVPATCTVTGSTLDAIPSAEQTYYCPVFELTVQLSGGAPYSATGYDELARNSGSRPNCSADRSGQEIVLEHYQIGQTYTCWYDPSRSSVVVFERTFDLSFSSSLFDCLLGAILVVGAVTSYLRIFREERRSSKIAELGEAASALRRLPDVDKKPGEQLGVRLSARSPFEARHMSRLMFGVFWNGILIFMLFKVGAEGFAGDDGKFFLLLLVPFVLVGLGMLYGPVRRILNWLMSRKTSVELSREPLEAGQHAQVVVTQAGFRNVRDFKVALTCRDLTALSSKIHITSNGRPVMKERVVHEEILHHQRDFRSDEPLQVSIAFQVPLNARPSRRDGNKTTWGIAVTVNAAGASGFEVLFPLRVIPAGTSDGKIFDL